MEVISGWELYWWTRLDSIIGFIDGLHFISVMVAFLLMIAYAIVKGLAVSNKADYGDEDEDYIKFSKTAKYIVKPSIFSVVIAVMLGVLSTLTPTKKDAAMIMVIPAIANNQHIQQEAGEIYTLAKQALAESIGVKEDKD